MVGAEQHGLTANRFGQAMPAGRWVIGDLAMQMVAAVVNTGLAKAAGGGATHRHAAERYHDDLAKRINKAQEWHGAAGTVFPPVAVSFGTRVQPRRSENQMNEDRFNMDIRKYLKTVGVTSQREIELAVRDALEKGKLSERTLLKPKMILRIPEIGLEHVIDGEIGLS